MNKCTCGNKVRILGENTPKGSKHLFGCPTLKSYLFYYNDLLGAYVPAPKRIEDVIDLTGMEQGEAEEIKFVRFDMSPQEFSATPQGQPLLLGLNRD